MHARVLMSTATAAALGLPAVGAANSIPVKHPVSPLLKQVGTRPVAPRVFCICVTIPASALPVWTEVQLEAQNDVELIAHGLDPAYASLQTTPEPQAEYDAVLVASGLDPYFKSRSAQKSAA